ncbi:MAG: NADH-quinone oxidoreductase subunit N [Ignavibacteriales bacterium]|nr:NADH-quinone oxidoreductase subunit N [Ignavibacteriales bacterium]
MDISFNDFYNSSPLIALVSFALLTLIVEGLGKDKPVSSYWMSLIGVAVSLVLSFFHLGEGMPVFGGMLFQGGFAGYCNIIFLSSALLTIILARGYLERMEYHRGEFYILVMFATTGMMLMAGALNLITIFLGIELMSVPLYVLAGFLRKKQKANESALKYFLLGAFATGFLLYGIALIYGVAGTTDLLQIKAAVPQISHNPLFVIGAGLLVVAFSFKVAAVPFHMWAPDVYEGAPTPVTGFMSTGAKAAAFATFLLVFVRIFEIAGTSLSQVIAMIAAASMIIGNISAVAQTNVKRMLAYSSIAHAGYMLSGIAAANNEGQTGILFYLMAYAFMNIGAFGIVSWVEQKDDKRLTFDDYAGLSARRPGVAALMAVFMFSLAGIPPFAGFFGKYYVFLAAVRADLTWLAIVGVMTSLISVYYYLRLVVVMYFREGDADTDDQIPLVAFIAVAFAALMVLALGVYPSLLVEITRGFFKI